MEWVLRVDWLYMVYGIEPTGDGKVLLDQSQFVVSHIESVFPLKLSSSSPKVLPPPPYCHNIYHNSRYVVGIQCLLIYCQWVCNFFNWQCRFLTCSLRIGLFFYLCHQVVAMIDAQGSYGNGNVGNAISQTVIMPSSPRDRKMLYHKKILNQIYLFSCLK